MKNQMIKRWIALCLALCCFLPLFAGCGKKQGEENLQILCTVFPLYDWVKNIVGDTEGVEVSLLVTNGSDLHSYQPLAEDVIRMANADLFFYVGGASDTAIEDALAAHASKTRVEVKMSEIPDVLLRELCDDSTAEHHAHEHGAVDEHLWLSLRNAKTASAYVTEQLCLIDEEHADIYRENLGNYSATLDSLHEEYQVATASAVSPMMLCADRFPFIYLAEDYGIAYLTAFEGCSTDANASPETILRLAKALDEHSLHAIVVTERSDGQLAESVRAQTAAKDQEIFRLDSMQSVTESDILAGATYVDVMKKNLETLRLILAS